MSAPVMTSIGKLRRVGPYRILVPQYAGDGAYVQIIHDDDGPVVTLDASSFRALADLMHAAADQADAEARARREARRIEEQTRARLHVLAQRAACRVCNGPVVEAGLCGLCIEARDRVQRIVGPAGTVAL